MKTLVIVPAYNEALNIEKTVKDVKEHTNYDYVVVNDGSKDNTKSVCLKNNFNLLSMPINMGLTSAIQLGMKYAYNNGYDIAIQFDGDGQHKAEYLKNLVNLIENNNLDVAIGSRFVTSKKPISLRMIGSRLLSFNIKITTLKTIKDPTSGMRAFGRRAICEFVNNNSLTPEPDTLVYMLKKGFKIEEVQVEMREREFGESYLSAMKSVKYMINMILLILFIRTGIKKEKEENKDAINNT